jgi:hypothetical protein
MDSPKSPLPAGQLPLELSSPRRRPRRAGSNAQEVAPPPRYLTRREAAAYVCCSLRFLDGMGLPFIRKGRCKLYDDAESFVVRLKNEALEAKQQGIPGFFLAPEKLSSVASRIERRLSATAEDAPRSQNVAEFATLALRSVN